MEIVSCPVLIGPRIISPTYLCDKWSDLLTCFERVIPSTRQMSSRPILRLPCCRKAGIRQSSDAAVVLKRNRFRLTRAALREGSKGIVRWRLSLAASNGAKLDRLRRGETWRTGTGQVILRRRGAHDRSHENDRSGDHSALRGLRVKPVCTMSSNLLKFLSIDPLPWLSGFANGLQQSQLGKVRVR